MGRLMLASLAAVALVAALVSGAGASSVGPAAKAAGSSSYIVVLKDVVDAAATTTSLERSVGFKSKLKYSTAIKGFAADLNATQLEKLRADSRVDFIQADGVVNAVGYVPIAPGDNAPTGVRRIGAAVDQTLVKK